MPEPDLARLREATRRAAAVGLLRLWEPLPHQIAPDGEWRYWLMMAGRGTGKTDAGSHYVDRHCEGPACLDGPVPHRVAIVAPTLGDARTACVFGPSGIKAHNPSVRFAQIDQEVVWPNGATARIFGAHGPDDVERLRAGGNRCLAWYEEWCAWPYMREAHDQVRLGLRLGMNPRTIITTTPKPRPPLSEMLARPDVAVTGGTMRDNPYLAEQVRRELVAAYGGTRLGRQEIEGELLVDVPGALWDRRRIDEFRNPALRPSDMNRIVVGVDPAVTSGESSNLTGIVVCGVWRDGFAVLGDHTLKATPEGWASKVAEVVELYQADCVVAEVNQGGDMVEAMLRRVDPRIPYRPVRATRGKAVRAEPISMLYEQGKVWHAGLFTDLEDQMCAYLPDRSWDQSPDRVDALVWALTELSGRQKITHDWAAAKDDELAGGRERMP